MGHEAMAASINPLENSNSSPDALFRNDGTSAKKETAVQALLVEFWTRAVDGFNVVVGPYLLRPDHVRLIIRGGPDLMGHPFDLSTRALFAAGGKISIPILTKSCTFMRWHDPVINRFNARFSAVKNGRARFYDLVGSWKFLHSFFRFVDPFFSNRGPKILTAP
jgi:hypothetical protein